MITEQQKQRIEEEAREPIQNALYATNQLTTHDCDVITNGIIQYLHESGFEIVKTLELQAKDGDIATLKFDLQAIVERCEKLSKTIADLKKWKDVADNSCHEYLKEIDLKDERIKELEQDYEPLKITYEGRVNQLNQCEEALKSAHKDRDYWKALAGKTDQALHTLMQYGSNSYHYNLVSQELSVLRLKTQSNKQ